MRRGECRKCIEGTIEVYDSDDMVVDYDTCDCCGGNWEFCPQCSAALEDQEEDR